MKSSLRRLPNIEVGDGDARWRGRVDAVAAQARRTEDNADAGSVGLCRFELLARIGGGAKKAASNKARPALPTFDMAERWMLSTDLGRRYARVSGDSNPIHLFALSAKLFGFKSHIAHGMWSKARTAAALQKKLGIEACTIEAEFKLPVFLPTTVELNYTTDNGAINFDLRDIKGEKVHMKGALQALK